MKNTTEFDNAFFEDLFRNSAAISAVTDVNGVLLKVNHRAMELFLESPQNPDSVIGRNILEFIHEDEHPKVIRLWKESISEQKEVNYDLRASSKDGRIMYFLINGRPIIRDGKVVLFHYQALNMIDQKVHEQNLLQNASGEILSLIASGFAHDFNNLLTVINGYSEILKMSIDEKSPIFHKVNQICQAGKQASMLTKRMLDFSRRSRSGAKRLDLNAEITNQESIIKHVAGENITIHFSKSPGVNPVYIESSRFATLLINLVVNAKEAMNRGGELTISTDRLTIDASNEHRYHQVPPGDYVRMEVKDTGEGMSEDIARQIFDPFFTTRDGGKGLGLWTAKSIVTSSNGYIFLETAPGSGTTFSIVFPLSSEESGTVHGGSQEVSEPVLAPESRTILVVEDDDTVRDLVCEVLKHQGHVVLSARNGGDALQLARQFEGRIDLLITDMIMRRIDGKMLSRKMKSIWPHIKVMFMSGYGVDMISDDDLRENIFLQKPFLPQDLIDKVNEALH